MDSCGPGQVREQGSPSSSKSTSPSGTAISLRDIDLVETEPAPGRGSDLDHMPPDPFHVPVLEEEVPARRGTLRAGMAGGGDRLP